MNAMPQIRPAHDQFTLYTLTTVAAAPTFRELADIVQHAKHRRYIIRDASTGAYYDPALSPDRTTRFSVLAPPNRTPQVGEKWLHRTLGEVEIVDTSTYRPAGAEWLVVRRLDGEDRLRRAVDPADLVGRAQ